MDNKKHMKLYDEVSRLSKKAELKPIEMIKVYHSFGVDQCGYEKFDPPNQKGVNFSCLRNHTKSTLQLAVLPVAGKIQVNLQQNAM